MSFKNLNSYYDATATCDKDSKNLYVTVEGSQAWLFFKGGIVITMIGTATIVAKIEELEIDNSSNTTTMRLTTSDSFWVALASGSRQKSLIKLLPVNQSFVKPSIQINLNFPSVAEKLAEFNLAIASGAGLNFNQALVGLEPAYRVTPLFNAGTLLKTFETFVADKVKAKLYKKGGNQLIEILDGSQQKGMIYNGAATPLQDQIDLYSYLDNMRYELREQGGDPVRFPSLPIVFVYNLYLVGRGFKVVVNNQSVKRVRRTRKDGKINYALEFASGQFSMEFASGLAAPFTLTIEKSTVEKNDYLDWNGSIRIIPANQWLMNQEKQWLMNQEDYKGINYSKKHGVDGLGFIIDLYDFPTTSVFPSIIASLTVDDKTIYGKFKLSEDNKVILTKPDDYTHFAWAAKMAAFPSDGTGFIASVAIGSAGGKWQTIQLKVDFANLDSALDVYKGFQNAQQLTVAQASAAIGALKVTEAVIASQVNNVDVLTATATFPVETVKWFNAANCLQITVAPNKSTDAFSVCKSNGVQENFSELSIRGFLDAAAYDITKEYENNLGQILNLSARGEKIEWALNLRSTHDDGFDNRFLYKFPLGNAEITQSASGTTYKFYTKAGVIPQFDLQGDNIIQFIKTAEQNVDGSKFIFVEDIAELAYGIWYLKGDTIIESNGKLTIKAGQQLRFNIFGTNKYPTLTNKGTIILDGELVVINVDPNNPFPTFINDGTILNDGYIDLSNGMTNNGAITNNFYIVNRRGTFTNNGSITNNATFTFILNSGSFVGNDVIGTPISYEGKI